MYSRSTRGRVFGGSVKNSALRRNERENVPRDGAPPRNITENEGESVSRTQKIRLPEPPPNYGGTVCGGVDYIPSDCGAEGIERLVNNDLSYGEQMARGRNHADDCAANERSLPTGEKETDHRSNGGVSGLKRIVEALGSSSFDPGDVLLCAMIMLMLNSRSEDDIIMIIVLMMLL